MKKILKFIPLFVLLCAFSRYLIIISISGKTAINESLQQENKIYTDKKQNIKSIRIINENLQADYRGFGGGAVNPRSEMFFRFLNNSDFDVCAVQEMSLNWYSSIKEYKTSIKIVRPLLTSHFLIMTGIIYNSDTVTLLKSGDLKYSEGNVYFASHAVWGLFLQKSTNRKFIVISTHLNLIREKTAQRDLKEATSQAEELRSLIKQLCSKYQCSVIISGDFNSKEGEKIYLLLCKELNDCNALCELKEKKKSTDHIFLYPKGSVLNYRIISGGEIKKMSDHRPVLTDILLDYE